MLGVALFLLAFSANEIPSVIPDELKSLADKARKNLRAHPNSNPMPKVGLYDLDGLSFDLKASLLNQESREIRGSAIDTTDGFLAIVPDRNLLNHQVIQSTTGGLVFVEVESQNLFKVAEAVCDDGTVMIFKAEQVDPFTVFSELNIKTAVNSKSNQNGADFKCEATSDHSFGARCKAEYGYNWQSTSGIDDDGMKKRALELPTDMPGFTTFHGAYVRGYSSFGVKIHSITNIDIDADLDIGASAGLGFRFKDHLGPWTLLDEGFRFPLYGYNTNFVGYKFGFSVDLFTTVSLKDVNLYFPQELYYYRQANAAFKVAGHYKNGVFFDQPNFTFSSTLDTNMQNFSVKDYLENIVLHANPEFNLGLDIQISTGSSTLRLEGGGRFGMHWDFSGNPDKCTVPWLYGDTDSYLSAFYENTEYKVWRWTVVPRYENEWKVWELPRSGDHCIFSDEKKSEGSRGTVTEKGIDFMKIAEQKNSNGSKINASTIIAIVLGVFAGCLLAALVVVSLQKKHLQEKIEGNSGLILDSEAKYT